VETVLAGVRGVARDKVKVQEAVADRAAVEGWAGRQQAVWVAIASARNVAIPNHINVVFHAFKLSARNAAIP